MNDKIQDQMAGCPAEQGEVGGNTAVCPAKQDLALRDKTFHNRFVYYVYVLKSLVDGRVYVGFSGDLKNRFKAHSAGRVTSTKAYKPWKLVYYEAYAHKLDATKREKQLKIHAAKGQLLKRLQKSLVIR